MFTSDLLDPSIYCMLTVHDWGAESQVIWL